MLDERKLELFKELFDRSKSIFIVYPSDATRDHLFSATALYKSIAENTEKEVSLLSPENLSKEEKDIVYLNETKTEMGHKNLCLSFEYSKAAVDNVSYHISEETNKFYLTIKPQKGKKPLDHNKVDFSYTGADAEMVILVGVDDMEDLEQLYYGYENFYDNTALVSINSYETSFGNLKIDVLGSSCISEYIAQLLFNLKYKLDNEVATNLLAGIDEETDNFESYSATADTFDVVSKLMRAGARRFARDGDKDDVSDANEVFAFNDTSPKPTLKKNPVKKVVKKSNQPNQHKQSNQKKKHIFKKSKKKSSKPGGLKYSPKGTGPSST